MNSGDDLANSRHARKAGDGVPPVGRKVLLATTQVTQTVGADGTVRWFPQVNRRADYVWLNRALTGLAVAYPLIAVLFLLVAFLLARLAARLVARCARPQAAAVVTLAIKCIKTSAEAKDGV